MSVAAARQGTAVADALTALNPATGEVLGRTPVHTPEQVAAVIAGADRALGRWRLDKDARLAAMRAAADAIDAHSDALATLLTREQGKPLAEAKQEIWIASYAFRLTADTQWETSVSQEIMGGRRAQVLRVPYGVVGAIVPWNFPIYLAAAKIAPALAAGNTVVVKPAESVTMAVARFVEILQSALPAQVLGLVVGGPDVGQALVSNRLVRKVSFTGSTHVGKEIIRQSAATVTPLTLELGGNDPAILLADADLTLAAEKLAAGALLNAGQMCIAPKRIYVPRALADGFAEALAGHASARVVGDGLAPETTMGPLHNATQLRFVEKLIADAVAGGASVVTGGARGTDLPGHFLAPTVLTGVDDAADVVRLEQFGPVVPVVAYDDVEDVLATIDSQEFGLGASVWSADEDHARALALGVDAGTVWINRHNALDPGLAFGGVRESGYGREGGLAGIEDFLVERVIN